MKKYNFTELKMGRMRGGTGYVGLYIGKGGLSLSKYFIVQNDDILESRVRVFYDKLHDAVALVITEKEGWKVSPVYKKGKLGSDIQGATIGNKMLEKEVGRGRFAFEERDGDTFVFLREQK